MNLKKKKLEFIRENAYYFYFGLQNDPMLAITMRNFLLNTQETLHCDEYYELIFKAENLKLNLRNIDMSTVDKNEVLFTIDKFLFDATDGVIDDDFFENNKGYMENKKQKLNFIFRHSLYLINNLHITTKGGNTVLSTITSFLLKGERFGEIVQQVFYEDLMGSYSKLPSNADSFVETGKILETIQYFLMRVGDIDKANEIKSYNKILSEKLSNENNISKKYIMS